MYTDVILISPNEIKSASNINYNVDNSVISNTARTVQDIYLEEIIGTALLRRIQELIYNKLNNLDDNIDTPVNEAYKILLNKYIKDFLIAKCLTDILMNISFKIRNIGVSRNSDTNINYADLSELKFLKMQYETYADEYTERLSKFLCANKEQYPELTADIPAYFKTPLIGKSFANCGIWIGKEEKNNCGC